MPTSKWIRSKRSMARRQAGSRAHARLTSRRPRRQSITSTSRKQSTGTWPLTCMSAGVVRRTRAAALRRSVVNNRPLLALCGPCKAAKACQACERRCTSLSSSVTFGVDIPPGCTRFLKIEQESNTLDRSPERVTSANAREGRQTRSVQKSAKKLLGCPRYRDTSLGPHDVVVFSGHAASRLSRRVAQKSNRSFYSRASSPFPREDAHAAQQECRRQA